MLASSKRGPLLALIASSVLWGLIWLPLKWFGQNGINSLALLMVAYGALSVVCLPLLYRSALIWRSHTRVMLLVFVMGGYANIAFNTSMMYGDVVRCMVLFYTLPVWSMLGGYVFLKEPITAWRACAAVLAITGAWLILGGMKAFETAPGWMDILALSSGFAYAMNNLCFRASPHIPVAPKIATMFLSACFFSIVLLVAGFDQLPHDLPLSIWGMAAVFGLVWILFANMGTQWGVTHIEAGRAAIIIVLELVVAVITATIWGGTHLLPVEWAGAALILIAAFMEVRDEGGERV
jgi:drug/metabolite transporter (DMT)-like permease